MTEAFILIDVQAGFTAAVWGRRNNPSFEARWAEALAGARAASLPVWHVRHLSLDPESPLFGGKPGSAFAAGAEPRRGEPAFEKHVNSAFIGTDLEARLRLAGITKLTLAGLTSDQCVSTTARMAANLGFEVEVLSDATATFERFDLDGTRIGADLVHRVSLASLNGEFATITPTRAFVARITDRSPRHAHA